ncbi:MAG: DEAD/DEAH box helicase [Actinomycetes bacterium]
MTFKSLGVHPALIAALTEEGKTTPFPIQKATLPEAIAGRDVLGRGQTGSGKTLAFGLAMMTRLAGQKAKPGRPLGLVLAPTRELAVQISEVIAPLARTVGLNSQVVAGGMSYTTQQAALKRGVPIIVATPGRLEDLLKKKYMVLDDVEITVLDEADQMADMGFLPIVTQILNLTSPNGQRLLFSATLDRDVDALVRRFLKDPVTHSLENEKSTAGNMEHHVLIVDQIHRDTILQQIAAREGRTIMFVKTKHGADKLADKLRQQGVAASVLHGGKTQSQRTRVLEGFKLGHSTALIATDVAARGIHVDDVSLVVHVDPPQDHKDYLHRAGRTARAGATGTVVSIGTHKQKKGIFGLAIRAGVKLKESFVHPMHDDLVAITGAQEPSGIPVIVSEPAPRRNERGGNSRGGRSGGSSERPRSSQQQRPGNFPKRDRDGGFTSRSDRPARPDREAPKREFEKKDYSKPFAEKKKFEPKKFEKPAAAKPAFKKEERVYKPLVEKREVLRIVDETEQKRRDRVNKPKFVKREDKFNVKPGSKAGSKPGSKSGTQKLSTAKSASKKSRDNDRAERFAKTVGDSSKKSASLAERPFRTNKFDPAVKAGARKKTSSGKAAPRATAKGGKKVAAKKPRRKD